MERERGLPDGWRVVRFAEIAEVNPRRPVQTGAPAPYIEMAAVREAGRGIAYTKLRKATGGGSKFQNGDTIFARITPCVENGKVALVDLLPEGACGFGSTEFIVLAPKEDRVHPKFLYYTVSSERVKRLAVMRMTGTSGRRRVPDTVFKDELRVLLPPPQEQERIAEILSAVDHAIERTEAVIEQVRVVQKAVTQDLLTRGIPGRHTRFKQTEVGEIPEEWEVVRLDDIATVTSGFSLSQARRPKDNPVPYLTVANVRSGVVDLSQVRYMEVTPEERESRSLRPHDIVLVEGHAQLTQLGRAALVPPEADGFTFQNHLFRIRVDSARCAPRLLCEYINGPRGRAYFRLFGGTTSGLNTVSATNVRRLLLPLPPLEEQQQVVALAERIERRLQGELAVRDALQDMKRALMSVLLTGQVRVGVASTS